MSAEIQAVKTPATKTDMPHGIRRANVRTMNLRPLICVVPDATLAEILAQMKRAETDAVFVCDDGHVVGIVASRDILRRVTGGRLDMTGAVRDFMTTDFAQLTNDATIGQVVETMTERLVQHVAISDDGEFTGAISDLDIVTFLVESYPKETMNLPPVARQMMDTREGE
ncbi:MAG: CBS domain-containing protein [Pyrinomonadaceae bacterium MAG19_C2-C3]|nr:CBS domain-containing protein [Pyrinomonadaceae bacterium MAG19_C2-C3]